MTKKSILKYIFGYLGVLFVTLSCTSTVWAKTTFAFVSIDETIFQLTTPIGNASANILNSLIYRNFLVALILSILIYIVIIIVFKHIKNKKSFLISLIILSICLISFCLYKIGFFSYLYNTFTYSDFIDKNYVDPKKTNITFPEEKKNLVYIYVESLESTYFNKDLGGGSKYNYIKPLNEITKENISFSDTEKFGVTTMVPGTTWTTGSMVAQTSGLPLKVRFDFNNRNSNMLDNAYSLGDILSDNGYNQMYMIGSDKSFGNRYTYINNHGNYQIYDDATAKKKGKIDKDYHVWWGYEDSKLFEYAKEEITNLASKDKPFNFTMLTANTHHVGGYLEKDCKKRFKDNYHNVIYCSSLQIRDFVTWLQKQDFYEDTIIVIVGDHVSMEPNLYPEGTNRKAYNVFINSQIEPVNNTNRDFTNMDYFPTILASMGVEIEGDRLGLGTNLFSDKKTLLEEYGYNNFVKEIDKNSKYYKNTFEKQ